MTRVAPLVWLALACVACQAPQSGFDSARSRLARGDLVGALVHLDRVPPTDPNFSEARSLATAVERRVRTSQRLFARGLSLRAQWRDEEAIESFELARDVWPALSGIDALIAATRARAALLRPNDVESLDELPGAGIARTQPVQVGGDDPTVVDEAREAGDEQPIAGDPTIPLAVSSLPVSSEPAPVAGPEDLAATASSGLSEPDPVPEGGIEVVPAVPMVETSPVLEPSSNSPSLSTVTTAPSPDEPLARIRHLLQAGDFDGALAGLESAARSAPGSLVVRDLHIRVLHQRALLHYGQGELAAAIDTWQRLLEIDPEHAQAREFHHAATRELESLRRR